MFDHQVIIEKKGWFFSWITRIFILALLIAIVPPSPAEARVPYTYQWENDPTKGTGINQLKIVFDYDIDHINTYNGISLIEIRPPATPAIPHSPYREKLRENVDYILHHNRGSNVIIISFPAIAVQVPDRPSLDLIRIACKYPDPDNNNWEVYIPCAVYNDQHNMIKQPALVYTANSIYKQLDDFIIPFTTREVQPGFRSAFMTASEEDINDRIFQKNAPRTIDVYVPSSYITKVTTIHRYEGVFPDNDLTPPQLFNVDINCAKDVTQVFLAVANIGERRLSYDEKNKCFTTGFAGVNADLFNGENGDVMTIKAYDAYGRLLEERDFKVRVGALRSNNSTDFVVDNYITSTGSLKPVYTLHELMQDPVKASNILARIPAGELDRLKISYPQKPNYFTITDRNEFAEAIASQITPFVFLQIKNDIDFTHIPATNTTPEYPAVNPTTTCSLILDGGADANTRPTIKVGRLDLGGGPNTHVEMSNIIIDGIANTTGAGTHWPNIPNPTPNTLNVNTTSGGGGPLSRHWL